MAAGLGFKTFLTGDVLTANDTNGYLMQGVLVFASAAARTAAITSPQEGQYSYLKDTNSTEYYTGTAWVASGGSSSTAWTLLNAGGTALTGAGTITVSGITKDKLLIFVKTASSASASSTIKLRFNSDAGTNYTNAQMAMTMELTYAPANFVASSPNDDSFKIGRMPAAATGTVSGYAIVEGCKNVGLNVYYGAGGGSATSSNTQQWFNYGGVYTGAAAITSVDVVSDTGNFDAGTVFVYGA